MAELQHISGAASDPTKDAADGVPNNGTMSEEVNKTLKRLGYPEVVEPAKPSGVLQKATAALSKRLAKLDEIATAFEKIKDPSNLISKSHPHLRSMHTVYNSAILVLLCSGFIRK